MSTCEDLSADLATSSAALLAVAAREIVPGVPMGRPDELLSPAYWKWRCAVGEAGGHDYVDREATLHEEVGFCLLGGFGIRAEMGAAFYHHLRRAGVFTMRAAPSEEALLDLLSVPLPVSGAPGGRPQRYRFPRQKAARLAAALPMLDTMAPDREAHAGDARSFRDALCRLPGIGPKTASWVARNWLGTETVAILDVHLLRIGRFLGLFDAGARLPGDYARLEARLLAFAAALEVRPSVLDAVMWDDMRLFGSRMVNQGMRQ